MDGRYAQQTAEFFVRPSGKHIASAADSSMAETEAKRSEPRWTILWTDSGQTVGQHNASAAYFWWYSCCFDLM